MTTTVAGALSTTEIATLKTTLVQTRSSHRHAVSDLRKKIRQHIQLQMQYYDLAAVVEEKGSGLTVTEILSENGELSNSCRNLTKKNAKLQRQVLQLGNSLTELSIHFRASSEHQCVTIERLQRQILRYRELYGELPRHRVQSLRRAPMEIEEVNKCLHPLSEAIREQKGITPGALKINLYFVFAQC